MPGERFAGIVELLRAGDFRLLADDLVHAIIADKRHAALQEKLVLAGKRAAQFAAALKLFCAVACDRLARYPERMTAGTGAPPGSFKQFIGNVARIGIANGLSVFADCFAESHRVGYRFLENRMQKLDDEFQRSFIVVVKS